MTPSPEIIAKARQAYIDGASARDICRDYEMSLHTLYVWLDGGPADFKPRLPAIPRRRDGAQRVPQRIRGDRDAIVKRMWRTAERQVREIEQRLAVAGQEPAERERDARMMAVLVKTLAELSALDGCQKKSGARGAAKSSPEPETDSDAQRDLSDFRRELATRIAALADGEPAEIDRGPDGTAA